MSPMRTLVMVAGPILFALAAIGIPSAHAAPGSVDTTFGSSGSVGLSQLQANAIAVQSDGKILVAGGTYVGDGFIARYLANGSLDATFGSGGIAHFAQEPIMQIGEQPGSGGKLLAIYYTSFGQPTNPRDYLFRVMPDGTTDSSFGSLAIGSYSHPSSPELSVQPDGGAFTADNDTFGPPIVVGNVEVRARFAPDGSGGASSVILGSTATGCTIYGMGYNISALAVQSDGKIVLGGVEQCDSVHTAVIRRLNSDLSDDTSFGTNGVAKAAAVSTASLPTNSAPVAMVLQPDGSIVYGFISNSSSQYFTLMRVTSSGVLDATFGTSGVVTLTGLSGHCCSLFQQPDGRIIAVGGQSTLGVARLLSSGALDATFGSAGSVTFGTGEFAAAARQADGRIVAVMNHASSPFYDATLVRFETGYPSSTTLGSSANPSIAGHSVTFTAAVTGGSSPVGTVAFLDGSVPIPGCTAQTVSLSHAQCTTSSLTTGTHSITASYVDTTGYYAPSTSAPLSQQVVVLIVGNDFNFDGRSDIVWRNSTDGSILQWLMNGTSVLQQTSLGGAGTTRQPQFVADFNGDHKADILWQDVDGSTWLTLMDGGTVISDTMLVGGGTGWSVTQVGDFNGDGMADLVWTHTSGAMQAWLMNGATATSFASFVPAGTGWLVVKLADLNGDGKSDIIWQHTDGTVQAWLMNGLTPTSLGSFVGAASGWTVALAADLDGDGKQDLIWSNVDGSVQAWLMNGLTVTNLAAFVPAGAGYTATATGDLNGDGTQDILWRYTDGTVIAWLMGPSLAVNQIASFTGSGNQYSITHVRDFDGDGKSDLLWQHPDGTVQMWLMNGLSVTSAAVLTGAGPYVVVPPMP